MNGIKSLLPGYIPILAIGCLLILSAEFLGLNEGMNSHFHDLFFRLRGTEEPDRSILIAAIDGPTLGRLGRWPLKRAHYARLLEKLGAARVVGLDILLSEPSEDDPELAAAILRHGRVVLSSTIDQPVPVLPLRSAGSPFRTGHVHLEQDIDGVVRKVYHRLYHDGRMFPSFASAMEEVITGTALPLQDVAFPLSGSTSRTGILQLDLRRINFRGDPGTFPRVSVADIIDGRFSPAFFTNRIILVGLTADGIEGKLLTPFSRLRKGMSGVEVHANILDNIIANDPLVEAPQTVRVAVSLLIALAGLAFFVRSSNSNLLVRWCLGMVAVLLASFGLLAAYRIWFSPVLLLVLLTFMSAFAHVIRLEQAGKRVREAVAEWEDSFNTIRDGIVLVDCNAVVTRMNEAARMMEAQRMLGLLGGADQPGSGTGDAVQARIEEIFDPQTENRYEVSTLSRSGRNTHSEGTVHIFRDITAAKRMEEEKESLRFQFLQAQKMESIGRLAGGIAHDFNNILTAIIGYSSMGLKKTGQDNPLAECLKIINESGIKAASLIRQLLVFSRRNSIELQVVTIGTVVDNMAKILRRVIGEDINLKLQTQSAANNVLADPGHIEQILMNLAVNARDAMPKGGTLDIRVDDVELDASYASSHLDLLPGPYVMLTVSDSGHGMTPEIQARIFEPFYTTKKVGEGTGLGLSTVYGIVKKMAGHIYVYSEVGRGTVFRVYFPVCTGQAPDTAGEALETPVGGSETILVAEDDTAILGLITSTLKPLGYTILSAGSGEEALKFLGQTGTAIDLLLTDVVMPGMRGRELADIVLERYPAARVVFMSGYTDETLILQGVEQQRCAFIQKPLMPDALARRLREVLDEGRREAG